jgi:signal transduction histidine kinase
MSRPDLSFTPPTAEFAAICQAQAALLVQLLKADYCAVYLTRDLATSNEEADLIPVIAYPVANSAADWGTSPEASGLRPLPEVTELAVQPSETLGTSSPRRGPRLAPFAETVEEQDWQDNPAEAETLETQGLHSSPDPGEAVQPMVFPLLDEGEEKVLGLLVAGRRDRPWQQKELGHIEKIVSTLALACRLDRQQWDWQQHINRQEQLRYRERERLDDLLHQLRNPLTALRTFGKLLLKRLLPEHPGRPNLEGILRESDRLRELLAEFEADLEPIAPETAITTLNASSPAPLLPGYQLPESALQLAPVSLAEILEPLLLSQQAIAQERQIQLIAQVPPGLPLVQANASALREVLSNLIDNALKYTPSGGLVLVKVGLSPTEGNAKSCQGIAIEDTGYGIPEGDQGRIFERNYRGVQQTSKIAGRGLGLAIVKDLVERMQGQIILTSPNDLGTELPGTTFTLWLPLSEPAPGCGSEGVRG